MEFSNQFTQRRSASPIKEFSYHESESAAAPAGCVGEMSPHDGLAVAVKSTISARKMYTD